MRSAILALGLAAALGGVGCSKGESESVIHVTVTAPTGMPTVMQLRAELSYVGGSEVILYPKTSSRVPVQFDVTLVLGLPRTRTGNLGIVILALDGDGQTVARGESAVTIVVGGRVDVTIPLRLAGTTDGGADTAGSGPDIAPANADASLDHRAEDAPLGTEVARLDVLVSPGASGGVVRGTGGTTGSGGSVGTGGRSGRGGASGNGGWAGGTGGALACPPVPLQNAVNFCNGRAQGEMTGWGWVAMGSAETLTSPVCDGTASDGGIRGPISLDHPCPSVGGQATWSAIDALCVSGSVPVVTGGDYSGNWGMQVGWNVSDPADTPLGRYHSQITFTWRGTTEPTNNAIRGEIHRKGDAAETRYCAYIRSGEPISLLSFNTKCWDKTGVDLTAEEIPDIDWIGVQITSDDKRGYTVNDFCVTGIYFDELSAGAGGTGGSSGVAGTGGKGGAAGVGGTTVPASIDCQDTSTFLASLTGQYEGLEIPVDSNANKTYYMQANWWGSPWNHQTEKINGVGFSMTNPPPNNVTSMPNNPMGYPSIYIGSYKGRSSKGSNLPKQLGSLSSLPTVFQTNADQIGWSGYSAAYDVWLTDSSSALSSGATSPCPGAYLMVWLFKTWDKQPRGSIYLDGHEVPGVPGSWTVWIDDSTSSCTCVSYVAISKLSSLEFDLALFLKDAANKKYGNITTSQYLSVVFAGFEVWSGGDGLELKRFCADVK